MPIEIVYAPRPDYARITPRLAHRGDSIHCGWGARVLNLRSDAKFEIDDGTAVARFTLQAGESRTFALGYDDHTPAVLPSIADDAIERTIKFWREWSSQLTYDGPHRALVLRSALVLKLLTYAPTGAIVAAPTTSLPESIGSVRNWDYRYCWLRDASWTVTALFDCGFSKEGAAFLDWLLYSTRLTHPHLQMLYDVFGESRMTGEDARSSRRLSRLASRPHRQRRARPIPTRRLRRSPRRARRSDAPRREARPRRCNVSSAA